MTTTSVPPNGAAKARLLRRTQVVARLRHPNLVRMLPLPGGAGLAPVLDHAHRLADFTLPAGTFKRFDLEQVVRLLLDVLTGLAALHEVGTADDPFVHGGVSPHTIYVDEHGTARLVPLLNVHFHASAKPEENGYAAPELLVGERADARADVFSVGVMLWEALAGKRLFPDPTVAGVKARVLGGKRPPISLASRLRWAQPLCAIAERAIAVEPGARYRTALELSHAMAAAAAPQLSQVDTDAWQEEAPTPVFQPRLHLATLRAATPPPAVLTLTPSEPPLPGVVASLKPAAPAHAETPQAFEALDAPAMSPRAWRGRVALAAFAVLAMGAAALWLPKARLSAPSFATLSELGLAPARVVASPAPVKMVELPQVAPVASAIPSTPAAAPSVAEVASAAAVTSAAPDTAASARPASARPKKSLIVPQAVPKAVPKIMPKSKSRADDYGI